MVTGGRKGHFLQCCSHWQVVGNRSPMLLLATLVKLTESPKRKDKIERLVGEKNGINRSGRNKRKKQGVVELRERIS